MEKGKVSKTKAKNTPNATLFVSMHNPLDKKKNLLYSLKNVLLLQQEYEKVIQIRAQKKVVLNKITKKMQLLNSKFQKVKKELPNVKNVLSNTEKEFLELNKQIEMLRGGIVADTRRISEDKRLISSLSKKGKSKNVHLENLNENKKKKVIDPRKLSKLERIQYNLELINQRLKNL